MAWTAHPGTATAAHRIVSSRAPDLVGTDADRAARVAAAHLPWLAHLDDVERRRALDEVVAALSSGQDLTEVLEHWSEVAARRLDARR